jgi:dihydrofolate reductase
VARLYYTTITSVDGYVSDANGSFEWSAPDEEVHRFVNELERPIGTYLYGRRLYEVMRFWESPDLTEEPQVMRDYAQLWQAADKVVYSTTLPAPFTARTRIERNFDVRAVRDMKVSSDRDLSVGGPELAAHALRAGLVDECHQFLSPVVVGGGQRFLPDGLRLNLELLDEHRFTNGVVHLHYRLGTLD